MPDSASIPTGLTALSLEREESRGKLPPAHLSLWLGGVVATGKERDFEEKKVGLIGGEIAGLVREWAVAATCKKGWKPESPNQDNYCVAVHGSALVLGVFDGHGPAGHEVSAFASLSMPQAMTSRVALLQNPANAQLFAFQQTQNGLLSNLIEKRRSLDCIYSGSTATVAVIVEGKLVLGHMGGFVPVEGSTQLPVAVQLTFDHKPNIPSERERIEAAWGQIRTIEGDKAYRVFFPEKNFPGLSITRAVGDITTQPLGITSLSDIYERKIEENDIFCCFAVTEYGNSSPMRRQWGWFGTMDEKKRRRSWIRNEEGVVDDITVLIAYFSSSSR